jgi:branched-chain amino acid transport system substrate-binding protein
MQKLVNVDNVEAVLSSYSSATLAILPIADEHGVAVVQSGAQADNLAGASEYLFNGIPLSSAETDGLLKYLTEEEGVETVAIAYLNDDSGNTTKSSMAASAEEFGAEVVGEASHELEQTDFRAQLIQLTASNPDAVLMATHSLPAALLAEQIREGGYDGTVAGTTFMTTPELLESDASEGLIHSSVSYDPPDEWVAQFEEEYGFAPGVYSGLFYDGILILGTAIGHVIEAGQEVTGDNIRDAIVEIGTFEGVTGTTEFFEDGTSSKPLAINEIRDNASVPIAEVEVDG